MKKKTQNVKNVYGMVGVYMKTPNLLELKHLNVVIKMDEERLANKIDAPKYKDLEELAHHALRRRKELLNELRIIERTLLIIAKTTDLNIDLDKNVVVEP